MARRLNLLISPGFARMLLTRDFEMRDAGQVRDLLAGAAEAAAWPADAWVRETRDFVVRIAEDEGSIAGVVIFRIVADEAEILNLAVQARCRRRGTGSRLMNDAMAACGAAGVKRIFLEVRDSNQAARQFYSRLGFKETGRRRQYYRAPTEDAVVLIRTL